MENAMTLESYEMIESDGVPIKAWTRGVQVEDVAKQQLRNLAGMPFIHKHIAAMPDVHWGMGATVGSVIATKGAFPSKRGDTFRAGHVYLIEGRADEATDTMRLTLGGAKWLRQYGDDQQVTEWQVAEVAAERAARAKALEKREAINTSQLDELMEPFRRAYNRLPIMDRPAFEVWMLTALRRR